MAAGVQLGCKGFLVRPYGRKFLENLIKNHYKILIINFL